MYDQKNFLENVDKQKQKHKYYHLILDVSAICCEHLAV